MDRKKVGARIKGVRGVMSQRAFAEKLDCGQVYICDIESGKTKPSIEFLIKLSALSGYSVDYLIMGGTLMTFSESEKEYLGELIKNIDVLQKETQKICKLINRKLLYR